MEKHINLINNYYIKIENNIPEYAINIINIQKANILKKDKILFKINFDELDKKRYKSILKELLNIKNKLAKKNIQIGIRESEKILLGYAISFNGNDKLQQEFILAINAILCNNKLERYNYIYDVVCDYLDSYFYGKNLCDFKDNQCQNGKAVSVIGCCKHPKHKKLCSFSNLIECEYLNHENYTCNAKCLPCKLFTCDYLRNKGVQFKIKDILLLDVFFNPLQKYFIKYMVFTPKEKILKRLMLI